MSSSGERAATVSPGPGVGGERLAVRVSGQRVLIGIRARPGASVTRAMGLYGDRLKVDVAAPPEAGRANKELVRSLASWVGVPADRVSVETGHASRDKVLAIQGIGEAAVRARLEAALGDGARGRVR